MAGGGLSVTDHAVLRYLERGLGVDVEGVRRRIARQLEGRPAEALAGLDGPVPQEFAVVADGLRFHCRAGNEGVYVVGVSPGEKDPHGLSTRARRLRRRMEQ